MRWPWDHRRREDELKARLKDKARAGRETEPESASEAAAPQPQAPEPEFTEIVRIETEPEQPPEEPEALFSQVEPAHAADEPLSDSIPDEMDKVRAQPFSFIDETSAAEVDTDDEHEPEESDWTQHLTVVSRKPKQAKRHRQRKEIDPATYLSAQGALVDEGYPGTDLTLYTGKRMKRAVGLKGRPKPRIRPVSQRGRHFYGRDLTQHVSLRNRKLSLLGLMKQRKRNPVVHFLIEALKWLFLIKARILIIERYIWTECFGYFLLGSFGFTIFMIITSIFSLGEKIFSKNIPPFTITKVLLISAPAFLVLALPVAVVFSSLMAMGRMNRDNEVVAFQTNGVSLYRIFIPFLALGIMAGIFTWLVYENVVPANNREYKEVLKVFWTAQVVDFIKPQVVIKAPEYKYFYVDSINKTEGIMYGVRLYDYSKGVDIDGNSKGLRDFPRIFKAEQAQVINKYLVLSDVTLFSLDERHGDSIVCATMPEIRIDIGTRVQPYDIKPHPTELSALELRTRILRQRDRLSSLNYTNQREMQTYLRDWTEYYFKYSIPVACLAFVLVAVPVSLRGPRDERNLGLIQSFILVMAFYILFFAARTVGARGVFLTKDIDIGGKVLLDAGTNLFPPYVAGWTAQAIFFVGAVVLIWRARK